MVFIIKSTRIKRAKVLPLSTPKKKKKVLNMDMTLYITQNTSSNSLCYSKGQIPNPLCLLSLHLHNYSVMARASAHISQSLLALWLLGVQPKDMDGEIQDKQLIFMLSSPPKQGRGEARNCELREILCGS